MLSWQRVPVLAAGVALAAAFALDRASPLPAADVARGSEEAFGSGLEPRELVPRQGPQRWTGPEALFRFRNLPTGPARVEVALHGHRSPVAVVVDGVIVGTLDQGAAAGTFDLPRPAGRSLDVALRTEGFTAPGGRRLGALLDRVVLRHAPPAWPAPLLALGFLVSALAVAWSARACGFAPATALSASAAASALHAMALAPWGLARSGHATTVALWVSGSALLAALLGPALERRFPGSGRGTFAVVMIAGLVQGLAATSPLMVVSDAVFHANKLQAVAGGDFFPTSVTQHAHPFRIPYGVSFYLLLAPLLRLGLEAVALVRWGAAASGLLASLLLYRLLLPHGTERAALAAVLLQLLPGVFDVYSYGNLSNAFGQAMTVAFFAWWAGAAPGGALLGAAVLLLGATAHLSSLIVLVVLVAALLAFGGARARTDRRRTGALLLGLGIAALYYLHFLDLVLGQLPRLLEGGGQGRGGATGVWGAVRLQLTGVIAQWGVPPLVLAWMGRPRRGGPGLDNDLRAFWAAGAALVLPALLTPLDVRYLYALTCPLAAAAGAGLLELVAAGAWRRWSGVLLLGAQTVLAARGILEAVLYRYRP